MRCCCVPGCNGNYRSGPKVSVFRFPKDEILRKKWLSAIRRVDLTITDNTVVCENHFKKTDIETEISAYDSKTGKTLTVPLTNKRLKTSVIPSIFPQSLNSTSSLSSRETPEEKRMRIEKEQLSLALQKSLKENCDTSQPDDAAGLSRLSKDNKQKKSKKRKKSDKKMSRKKEKYICTSSTEENSESDDTFQSHNLNKSRSPKDLLKKKDEKIQQQNQKDSVTSNCQKTKGSVSATTEKAANIEKVQIKEEPPWEEGYNVSINTSKNKPQENPKDKETNETVSESCDITFYKKPFSIDKRDDVFGKFVACEMSDLRGNPELYLKTQQSILKILVEAHFEVMSAT